MNYVKAMNNLGLAMRQLPCYPGKGAPTTATEGAVGDLYMDTDTGAMYRCTAAYAGVYIWIKSVGILVTLDEATGKASNTAMEIYDHNQNGGSAVCLYREGSMYALAESTSGLAKFVNFDERSDGLVQMSSLTIDSAGTLMEDSTTLLPSDASIEALGQAISQKSSVQIIRWEEDD